MSNKLEKCPCGGSNPTCPTCNDLGGVQDNYRGVRPVILKDLAVNKTPRKIVNVVHEIKIDLEFVNAYTTCFHSKLLNDLKKRISYWQGLLRLNKNNRRQAEINEHLKQLMCLIPLFEQSHKEHEVPNPKPIATKGNKIGRKKGLDNKKVQDKNKKRKSTITTLENLKHNSNKKAKNNKSPTPSRITLGDKYPNLKLGNSDKKRNR
jgi:hypothetical protein